MVVLPKPAPEDPWAKQIRVLTGHPLNSDVYQDVWAMTKNSMPVFADKMDAKLAHLFVPFVRQALDEQYAELYSPELCLPEKKTCNPFWLASPASSTSTAVGRGEYAVYLGGHS